MVLIFSPVTVRVEREALEVIEERITPLPLKLVEEARRIYPSDVAEEGLTGNAAQFAVMDEANICRKASSE